MQKVTLPAAFVDSRGVIQNLLEQQCNGVAIIHTKAGSYRSNHYHRTDAHWLFVLSGELHYTECPVDGEAAPVYPPFERIREGELFYTGPMMWHRVYSPVDTVLISMSLRPRDHASHEDDVVRAP